MPKAITSAESRLDGGLICQGLSFSYGGEYVLHNVSLEIGSKGFYALVGRSGVGKTTLAKIFSGMLLGYRAEKLALPKSVFYCHSRERLPAWKSVDAHLHEATPEANRHLMEDLLKRFSIDESTLQLRPFQLSTGQLNRINVVRYLVQDFDLLILDEALSNVDEESRHLIISEMKKRFSERIILLISHQLIDVSAFAKSIIILDGSSDSTKLTLIKGKDLDSYSTNRYEEITEQLKDVVAYI
jgi:ABC-type multidrug transport system ATPase subunit